MYAKQWSLYVNYGWVKNKWAMKRIHGRFYYRDV